MFWIWILLIKLIIVTWSPIIWLHFLEALQWQRELSSPLIVFSLLKWAFYMFWIDLRVQAETTLLGCDSTTFRRGEMYCFHIICGVNSSTLHLTELFWWFESQDQGVFGSSTSISKKVILWWIYIIDWVLDRGGTHMLNCGLCEYVGLVKRLLHIWHWTT